MIQTGNDWEDILREETSKEYFRKLQTFLDGEYAAYTVFPPRDDIFNALKYSSYDDTKVVIMGQDPYFNPGQAHGLCFSVNKGVTIPPSLRNIYKEQHDDLGITQPNHGFLADWAQQGVLLLNATLTVAAGNAGSHQGKGWEMFTDAVVAKLAELREHLVFMLWGRPAQEKMKMLDNPAHLILTAPHPSPLSASRGFFGCRHFSKCNEFLISHHITPIDWQIPDLQSGGAGSGSY